MVDSYVLHHGAGEAIPGPVGGGATIKADTAATAGAFTLLEIEVAPGLGPPQHLHQREDEMWFVLDGSLRFLAGERILPAGPGSFVFVPRGTAHCFQNVGATPARLLVMFAPSGMERFFREHAALTSPDEEQYRLIAERSWMEVTGPPLARSHPIG
ncbi:MAG: cupin domain-containing protein [Acidimicrobiia bacterium]|nr:cupin domain-containing protein [Acidimicrobiia bacterium]MBT8216949.1 cupin domain-containing protein [Acidimicrobiia bacterium]NNF11417.1 cupin domain-containing protein [Acidimicrobiia bacterium]NNL69150.1 cupin domain-containing protein [Acidimicrobiia bacterium]